MVTQLFRCFFIRAQQYVAAAGQGTPYLVHELIRLLLELFRLLAVIVCLFQQVEALLQLRGGIGPVVILHRVQRAVSAVGDMLVVHLFAEGKELGSIAGDFYTDLGTCHNEDVLLGEGIRKDTIFLSPTNIYTKKNSIETVIACIDIFVVNINILMVSIDIANVSIDIAIVGINISMISINITVVGIADRAGNVDRGQVNIDEAFVDIDTRLFAWT